MFELGDNICACVSIAIKTPIAFFSFQNIGMDEVGSLTIFVP